PHFLIVHRVLPPLRSVGRPAVWRTTVFAWPGYAAPFRPYDNSRHGVMSGNCRERRYGPFSSLGSICADRLASAANRSLGNETGLSPFRQPFGNSGLRPAEPFGEFPLRTEPATEGKVC